MVEIFVKKHSGSKAFRPHYNRVMGKYYNTKDDYLGDMKKHKLEPYNPDDVPKQKRKDYKPTEEYLKFAQSIKSRTDKDGNIELSGCQKEFIRRQNAGEK